MMTNIGREGILFPLAMILFIAMCCAVVVRQFSGILAGNSSHGVDKWPVPSIRAEETSRNDRGGNIMGDFWWMQSLKTTKLSLESTAHATSQRRQISFDDVYGLTGNHTIKRLWIDVGVHEQSEFLTNLNEEADLFLIGFEPSTKWKPCKHDRCVVLWAACTPDYGVVSLNIQDGDDLCNSLLKPNNETKSKLWRGCVTQLTNADGSMKVMEVPGMPLHELVHRIPDHVVVEYVKVDAQGYDLEVMKGLLPVSHRVHVVSLEAMDVNDTSKVLYHGQPLLAEMIDFLESKGWVYVASYKHEAWKNDENAFFVSDAQYASKVDRLANGVKVNRTRS